MAQKAKPKAWSYRAGKKGTNRVRAYEDGRGGPLYLEWLEAVFDNVGVAEIDPTTGRPRKRRVRLCLSAEGITSRSDAIKKAEAVSERFGELGPGPVSPTFNGPVTLGKLLTLYLRELSPTRKPRTERYHQRAARMFLLFFGANAVVERIGPNGRPQTEIGRARFNAFKTARLEGTIPGYATKAKTQTVAKDCRFLQGVFRWARLERDDGSVLLVRNPWEGMEVPKGDVPIRAEMTKDLHDQLVANAINWRMALVMEICRETRRRMNSVRQLTVADVSVTQASARWRGECDKVGKTRVTPLSSRAVEAVREALKLRSAEGVADSPWLFPAPTDPTRPVPRNSLNDWMSETKKRVGITIKWLGYHGEKRAGVRDPRFRRLDPAVQEELTGTSWQTLRTIYDYVDFATLQEAVAVLESPVQVGLPGDGEGSPLLARAA